MNKAGVKSTSERKQGITRQYVHNNFMESNNNNGSEAPRQDIDLENKHKIINVPDPDSDKTVVHKLYVDQCINDNKLYVNSTIQELSTQLNDLIQVLNMVKSEYESLENKIKGLEPNLYYTKEEIREQNAEFYKRYNEYHEQVISDHRDLIKKNEEDLKELKNKLPLHIVQYAIVGLMGVDNAISVNKLRDLCTKYNLDETTRSVYMAHIMRGLN